MTSFLKTTLKFSVGFRSGLWLCHSTAFTLYPDWPDSHEPEPIFMCRTWSSCTWFSRTWSETHSPELVLINLLIMYLTWLSYLILVYGIWVAYTKSDSHALYLISFLCIWSDSCECWSIWSTQNYVRYLFTEYSSAFNTISQDALYIKTMGMNNTETDQGFPQWWIYSKLWRWTPYAPPAWNSEQALP